MANINSALFTAQTGSAGSSPAASYPLDRESQGKLRFATIETTVASLGATNDTFTLCKLPIGAVVLPNLSKITCENPGTTVTGKIGDVGDDDRYLAAYATGGGAKDVFWSVSPGVGAYVGYKIEAGNETLVWTSTNIGTPTATAKFKILVAFLLP
jgi:hypothetical protein